jgi:hypothetical protein
LKGYQNKDSYNRLSLSEKQQKMISIGGRGATALPDFPSATSASLRLCVRNTSHRQRDEELAAEERDATHL